MNSLEAWDKARFLSVFSILERKVKGNLPRKTHYRVEDPKKEMTKIIYTL